MLLAAGLLAAASLPARAEQDFGALSISGYADFRLIARPVRPPG